jgi:hypothetical protein
LEYKERSTVVIKKSTRLALKHLARKDQTYDDLITELLNRNKAGLVRATPTGSKATIPQVETRR